MSGKGYSVKAIVAMCSGRGIGKSGNLPWRLRKELSHFAKLTTTVEQEGKKNAVIMGHNTWKSIPEKFRPLPKRINVVLSRSVKDLGDNVIVCASLQEALGVLGETPLKNDVESVWVIGGSSVYAEAMSMCDAIYLTEVLKEYECDTFLPELPAGFKETNDDPNVCYDVQEEAGVQYQYKVFKK
ncbi:hypothetical protein LSTR_LSTR011327 [Laodelphax striatellus]|uniref:dihydrofolate reductase n=1 Tax=Laodelphax striatellus TaxID=195883 RepID=A0A482WG50_LAOST|nr:hypothetical protein LSTR_LSTR011327 [Laodelphax striatellus]